MGYAFNRLPTSERERPAAQAEAEHVVIGGGTVKLSSASFRGAEAGEFEMQLSVDLYNRDGGLVGWYDVEMSAMIGGPGASDKRGSFSFGVIEFEAILKPPLFKLDHRFTRHFTIGKLRFLALK
jgi:hypothetical protein